MTPRDDVILSFSSAMSEGTTMSSQTCPSCKGGHGGERSMSVGRAGRYLWWQCHRASCGFRGKYAVNGDSAATTDEKRGRYREYKTSPMPAALNKMFAEQMGLDEGTVDAARWSYTPDYDGHGPRVVMPIFSPEGTVRGHNFRSYSGQLPKALVNAELAEEAICWYRFRKYTPTLIITEDQPSALRVTQAKLDGLALMGVTINDARATEIRSQKYNKVVLCLDNDAIAQAVRLAVTYQKWIPNLIVKFLDCDIKNMTAEQFDLFITEVNQA